MGIKKEVRCTPTFVNLKSNTMKKSHYKCKVPVVIFQISECSCYFFCISFTEFYCFRTRIDFLREKSIHSVPDKAEVANLFQSFHRTFQPLKRVIESDFYSVIIFYFCLYTTRNYGKTHFYICLLATPFLHDVGGR